MLYVDQRGTSNAYEKHPPVPDSAIGIRQGPASYQESMNTRCGNIANPLDELCLVSPNRVECQHASGGQWPFSHLEKSIGATFENAPDPVVISDSEGNILRVNAETERLFGYERHELVGERVERLIPERFRESHKQHRAGYSKTLQSRPMSASREIVGLKRDGSEIPIAISLNRVENREGTIMFAIIHDMTEWVAGQRVQREAKLERALSELSAKFINLPPEHVDGEIRNGLQLIAEALGGDRATVALRQASGDILAIHAWTASEIPEFPRELVKDLLPWTAHTILKGHAILGRPNALPVEAANERRYMEDVGIKTAIVVPFRVGGEVIGGMSCDAFRKDQPWDDVTLARFQAAADVFANALSRKHADEKLRNAHLEIRTLRDNLENENRFLREEIELEHNHHAVLGVSRAIRSVLRKAEQVARTDSTVLIMGETGTGKELIARTIHEMSQRGKRPLVKVNCAALPATLIESELFGRQKGAYTGALAREIGRFEVADKSTIFLDEVGEIPPEVQAKLLRVLQEGEFERLGSSRTISVNVRVIAATNRDLWAIVKSGKFARIFIIG